LAATGMQADRHTPWLPSAERDKEDPELAAVLRQVSDNIKPTKLQFVSLRCMHRLIQIRQHVACHDRAAVSYLFSSRLLEGHTRNADLAPLQVSINNEVMVAISNRNYAMPGGMLTTWMENVKRAGVNNAMVVALDAQTKTNAEAQGIVAHEMHLEVSTLSDDLCARRSCSYSSMSAYPRKHFSVDPAARFLMQSAVLSR